MNVSLSARQIWGAPIVIGVVSAVGLISALLGDGGWDVLSWFALGAPVTVIIWYVYASRSLASPKIGKRL
jgi:hypothetical protein